MNEENDNTQEHIEAPDNTIEDNWSEDWEAAAEKAAASKGEQPETDESEEEAPSEQTDEPEEDKEPTEEPAEETDDEEPSETEEVDPEVQLEELAEKLGYSIDKGKVETRERVNFRRQYRSKVAELEEKIKGADAKYAQVISQVKYQYEPLIKMKEAVERGDLDAVATNLGYNSFTELQIAHTNGNTPENAKMRQMQNEMRQMQAQQAQTQQQAAQVQKLEQAEKAYQNHIATTLSGYTDTAQYANDPSFIQGVVNVQKQSIDPRTGQTTLSLEQAATLILDHLPGGRANVAQGSQSQESEGVADTSANQTVETGRKKPPKTVTRNSTSEASSSDKSAREDETDEEYFARWTAKM